MTTVALAQLYALRTHLDAVILAAEAEAGVTGGAPKAPRSCPQCGADPEQIQDTSTLDGTKRSRCSACGHEWER